MRCLIVTGAAGALGAAVARAVAEPGVRLTLVDRDGDALREVADSIRGQATEVLTVEADVSVEADVLRYVAVAAGEHGQVHGFANNAGIEGPVVPLLDYPVEGFDSVLAVNVRGVFLGLKHVGKRMPPGGSIVNTASVGGLAGAVNLAGYIASKHAVVGLTRAAALEFASGQVRVNAVCPGPIRGPMMQAIAEGLQVDDVEALAAAKVPLGRAADADEVAALIAFLLSPASSYMTGAALPVDGGRLA